MNGAIRKYLRARLTELLPQSLLVVGIESGEIDLPASLEHDVEVYYLQSNDIVAVEKRYDLGVILLDEMTQECWSALALTRDVLTRRLIVIVSHSIDTPNNDFIALGMQRIKQSDLVEHAIYEYDIATYKPTPDWLSAESWANPEQWEKKRW